MIDKYIPKQLHFVKNKIVFLYMGLCPPLCVLTQYPTSFATEGSTVSIATYEVRLRREEKWLYFILN